MLNCTRGARTWQNSGGMEVNGGKYWKDHISPCFLILSSDNLLPNLIVRSNLTQIIANSSFPQIHFKLISIKIYPSTRTCPVSTTVTHI